MKSSSKNAHWLLKTEPGTYSFEQLLKDRRTNWNGVRNFQARNYLRTISVGDLALIYHSGDDKAVVGVAEVVRAPYKDPDPEGGDWVQVDLKPVKAFKAPVKLAELKSTPALAELPLIRHTRLSVMPITPAQYKVITALGGIQK